ncbi:ABC transporter permease [Gemmatimonadota bacterium]
MIQWLRQDIPRAVRTLLRTPRFTIIAAFTLAIAVGANTAIFSAVNGILLEPLPYPDSDRLVGIFSTAPGLGYDRFTVSPGVYYHYREQNTVFDDVGMFNNIGLTLTGDGEPERVEGLQATPSVFSVLQVAPARGRIYTEEEDHSEASAVVVVSHSLWERRFGSDPEILGRTVQINGVTHEIIGVMPQDFGFPDEETDLWAPTGINPADAPAGEFSYNAVARLKQGITAEVAQAQLLPLVHRLTERFGDEEGLTAFLEAGQFSVLVDPWKEILVGDLRLPLMILLGTVGFVLLIACANVANLFLVRAEARQREMATRTALGATRGTLVQQYLTESFVLATFGGLGGLFLAWVGIPALLSGAPPGMPRMDLVGLDTTVLLYTVGITAFAAVLFGIAPVFRYTGPELLGMLKYAGRGMTSGRRSHLLRNALVVAQTGMALVLLVGSGLLVRSFQEIRKTDGGFDPTDVLNFRIALPAADYPDVPARALFHGELLDRIRGLPGVEAAGAGTGIPLSGEQSGTAHEIEDFPTGPDELPPIFWYKFATPGYFEALGIPLIVGRPFEDADHHQNLSNVVVSSTIAERFWPEVDPVGKRLGIASSEDSTTWMTIVGVVGSVRDQGLREEATEIVYYPMVQPGGDNEERWSGAMTYAIKARNPENLAAAVRAQVWEMDADLPIAQMRTMEELVSNSLVRLSFTMLALGVAAFMALILGAVGLFGVLSYVVSQRTQEIGVRMALGAETTQVQKMVVVQGIRISVIGLAVGLVGAGALTRLLQGLLFGTAPLDPLTFVAMSVLLLGVGLLASYLPARKAAAVNPVESMRIE